MGMNGHLKSYLSPICVSSHGTFSRRKKKKTAFMRSFRAIKSHFFKTFFHSRDFFFFFFLRALAYLQPFINYSDAIVLAVRGGVCHSHAAVQIAFSHSEGFPRNDLWAALPSCCCRRCTLTVERRGLTSQHVEDAPHPRYKYNTIQ